MTRGCSVGRGTTKIESARGRDGSFQLPLRIEAIELVVLAPHGHEHMDEANRGLRFGGTICRRDNGIFDGAAGNLETAREHRKVDVRVDRRVGWNGEPPNTLTRRGVRFGKLDDMVEPPCESVVDVR